MWEIVGIDQATGARVEIAIADNEAEREMILDQERRARVYRRVYAVRISAVA